MICNYAETKRGFRFPVVLHLSEAAGALTLGTGVETQIFYVKGIKNAR